MMTLDIVLPERGERRWWLDGEYFLELQMAHLCGLVPEGTLVIAAFSVAYSDQNEQDYAVLQRAIQDGKIEAVVEEPK
jgi:hypothetical protein